MRGSHVLSTLRIKYILKKGGDCHNIYTVIGLSSKNPYLFVVYKFRVI